MIEILVGLPGSGKTTYARRKVAYDPNTIRVNKDDLRKMLHNRSYTIPEEEIVCKVRDDIILGAINDGFNVIVDDTNSKQKHIDRIVEISMKSKFTVAPKTKIVKFETPLQECIDRDFLRSGGVGRQVIEKINADLEKLPYWRDEDRAELRVVK